MIELHELTYKIRDIFCKVHTTLGPGLLESVYGAAWIYEFEEANIKAAAQIGLPVIYNEVKPELRFRIDILIKDKISVGMKSTEHLLDVHTKQLLTYLKLADKELGFLVNFNVTSLIDKISLIRIIN